MCLVTQSYLTLCSSVDCSQHGSSVHGIFPARILEWIAIPYSRNSFWPRNWTRFLASRALAGRFLTTAAAKSLQSCRILCDPIDGSPWGSPVPGILQARALEWVAISFSNTWKWKVKVKLLSRIWLVATRWTVAHQAPPSMEFSRQEYWSGVLIRERKNLKTERVAPGPSPTTCILR